MRYLPIYLLLFGQLIYSQEYDFRQTKWGMSKDSVKAIETAEYIDGDNDALMYSYNLLGLNSIIYYHFTNNKLYNAGYLIIEKHTNENSYIIDFKKLKESLIKKYGEPNNDDVFWYNDLYKSDYQEWGFAISIGHLGFQSIWDLDNTELRLMLKGDNYNITLGIVYESKTIQKEENLNDL